jgi:hypothetical protein
MEEKKSKKRRSKNWLRKKKTLEKCINFGATPEVVALLEGKKTSLN